MGFTFSHPALILPFRYLPKKYYSLSGLVIGSIVPDFEYFIRFDNNSFFGHTFLGLFWFDLPLAILILLFFHQVVRNLMIANLPHFLKTRLSTINLVNWPAYFKKNWIIVVFSVLIGCVTHLFWDSFTSSNGYFSIHNPILLMKTNLLGIEIFNYKILKHVSSLLGGMVLIYQLLKLPKSEYNNTQRDKHYWIIVSILFCAFILFQFLQTNNEFSYNDIIKKFISCGLFALIFTSMYYKTKMYLYQRGRE